MIVAMSWLGQAYMKHVDERQLSLSPTFPQHTQPGWLTAEGMWLERACTRLGVSLIR